MTFHIQQNKLRDDIKKKIFSGFSSQAIQATGINGLSEESVSFEIFDKNDFVGAIVVQTFWAQLHIKYLFVEEKYRGRGLGKQLMHHALEYGKRQDCQFAFVETMSFQAPEFYQKMGFVLDFSRKGYAKETSFHYLKKALVSETFPRQKMRVGVYGIAEKDGMTLLIRQQKGPFAGKLDFPGGGIEFGESPEQALKREFVEEVAMEFDSLKLLQNLSATISVSADSYIFYQIGMIYEVHNIRQIKDHQPEFQPIWVDLKTLTEKQCSQLLWKYKVST